MADNYTFKDAAGNTVTHASEDIGSGVQASEHVSVDDAGVMIAKVEDAAHSSGDTGIMALAVRKDTAAALAGSDGDYIPLIVDANGYLHVRDAGVSDIVKTEDAAHSSGDKGVMALAVRRDTPTSMVNADGDYIPLTVDSSGRLHVTSSDNATAGDVAHDAADSGNPLKIGGKAATSAPTAVAAGDRVNAYFDANGRLVVNLAGVVAAGRAAAAASLPVALANEQLDADDGTAVTNFPSVGAYYLDMRNTDTSGINTGKIGRVRMTQQRELLVAPRARFATGYESTVAYMADCLVSTTNAYSGYAGATTAFFNGADAGFGATSRYVRIPMLEFTRGAFVGLYHNLGVNLTVSLRADLTGQASAVSMNRPVIDTVSVASGGSVWFTPMPLAAGADASMRYVPMLNMPMYYLILQLLPASDPSSGSLYLSVTR